MKFSKIEIISLTIFIFGLILNYPVINANLAKESLGIFMAFALFFYCAKAVKYRVDIFLFLLIIPLQIIVYQLHINSFHFLSLEILVILLFFSITKKFSFLGFIGILLFTTLFNYAFNGISSEIKQEITKWVFYSLKDIINISHFEGVNCFINGVKITIDSSCMGLNLFKTGILLAIMFVLLEEKRLNKNFTNLQLMIYFTLVVFLNIISNYFRIVTLILTENIEDNFIHHFIGWFSFLVYQIIPCFLWIRYCIKPKKVLVNYPSKPNFWFFFVICIPIFITSFVFKKEKEYNLLFNLPENYKKGNWVIKNEVYKKINQDTLIYIKAPFHNPTVCWTGSGYKITNQAIMISKKDKIHKLILEKNKIKYHSYYWYQVGNVKETSYIKASLKGLLYNKPIQLINETVRVRD